MRWVLGERAGIFPPARTALMDFGSYTYVNYTFAKSCGLLGLASGWSSLAFSQGTTHNSAHCIRAAPSPRLFDPSITAGFILLVQRFTRLDGHIEPLPVVAELRQKKM